MKRIITFVLLVSAWAAMILLGRYVDRGWYIFMILAALPSVGVLAWIFTPDYTPEEEAEYKAKCAAIQAKQQEEYQRWLEASPAYRERQIETLLYQRAQTGDVAAMKAYLDHQEQRARRPRPDWTPTDIMLGNG